MLSQSVSSVAEFDWKRNTFSTPYFFRTENSTT